VEVFFYPMLPYFRKSIAFGRLPGFALLSFWYEKYVDDDEYGAMVQ
jgi:hypothetical protein